MGILGNIFVGEFSHQLDAKNRLCIPSKWRFVGDETDAYLALPNPIGCITIYPPKMVARLEEKVSAVSLGDTKGQKVRIWRKTRFWSAVTQPSTFGNRSVITRTVRVRSKTRRTK